MLGDPCDVIHDAKEVPVGIKIYALIHHCRLKLNLTIEIWIAELNSSYLISVFTWRIISISELKIGNLGFYNLGLSQSTKIGRLKSQTSNRDLNQPITVGQLIEALILHVIFFNLLNKNIIYDLLCSSLGILFVVPSIFFSLFSAYKSVALDTLTSRDDVKHAWRHHVK